MTRRKARSLALRGTRLVSCLALAAIASSIACGGGGGSGPQPPANPIDPYVSTLKTWAEYSPTRADEPAHPTGDPVDLGLFDAKDPQTQEVISFRCESTPYKVVDTPDELIVFGAPTVVWPGALIQGKTYDLPATADGPEGPGALLALPIEQRAPLKVSIPALMTAGNFREVVPSLATVASAIGDMIGSATTANLQTGSTVAFSVKNHDTDVQVGLETMGQAKFPLEGIPVKAGGSFALGVDYGKSTVVAYYMEKMFDVVVAPPQTPSAFFSSALTQAVLDEQIQLGRIGPDNLPLYVSKVGYGRMFIFKFQSTMTKVEIETAFQAGIDLAKIGGDAEITARIQAILADSEVKVAAVGGPITATVAMIKGGDWSAYFDDPTPPLSTAVPISFELRSLKDNTVAKVTELTTYGHRTCTPVLKPAFRPRQPVALALSTPFDTASGDLDGDGRADLVGNHLGQTNEVRVALGKADGTFDVTSSATMTVSASPAGGWAEFELVVADLDGDGRDELAWNRTGAAKSETYVARWSGDGSTASPWGLELLPVPERTEAAWAAGFWLAPARVTAKAGLAATQRDLLWNLISSTDNTVVASVFGVGTPTALAPQALPAPAETWAPYAAFIAGSPAERGTMVGDLDADGLDDLAWGAPNAVCTARNDGAWGFAVETHAAPSWPQPPVRVAQLGTSTYAQDDAFLMGDVNGDGRADVLRYDKDLLSSACWARALHYYCPYAQCEGPVPTCTYYEARGAAAQVLVADGAGGFTPATAQSPNVFDDAYNNIVQLNPLGARTSVPFLRDVNGDGKADLVWVELSAATASVSVAIAETDANRAFLGFGAPVTYALTAADLPPGVTSWVNFRPTFADVNGDGVVDVVLSNESTLASIYVLIRGQ